MNEVLGTAWMTQTALGKLFGVSSHAIGKWLVELGLRTKDGIPTLDALTRGLAKAMRDDRGFHFYVWDREAICALLRRAGHRQIGAPPPRMAGPFILQAVEDDAYEIRGDDGLICTVFGERNAKWICRMIEWFSKNETALPS